MRQAWLRCMTADGMFSNERTVRIERPVQTVFFAPANTLNTSGTAIRVTLVGNGAGLFAVLPNSERVPVCDDDLSNV